MPLNRFPRAARRHRSPYHFSLHRYVRRLVGRRRRHLSAPRKGLRNTRITRKQSVYLGQVAFPSRARRRMGGAPFLEKTKRYFAPRIRRRVRRIASRSFLPMILAALYRRRSERRFVKLCKQFSRRRLRPETRTARRETNRYIRRRRRHKRPHVSNVGKGQ